MLTSRITEGEKQAESLKEKI